MFAEIKTLLREESGPQYELISWPEFNCTHARFPTENNENFTKKCGISELICDTASRAIYLNTRLRLRLKG